MEVQKNWIRLILAFVEISVQAVACLKKAPTKKYIYLCWDFVHIALQLFFNADRDFFLIQFQGGKIPQKLIIQSCPIGCFYNGRNAQIQVIFGTVIYQYVQKKLIEKQISFGVKLWAFLRTFVSQWETTIFSMGENQK